MLFGSQVHCLLVWFGAVDELCYYAAEAPYVNGLCILFFDENHLRRPIIPRYHPAAQLLVMGRFLVLKYFRYLVKLIFILLFSQALFFTAGSEIEDFSPKFAIKVPDAALLGLLEWQRSRQPKITYFDCTYMVDEEVRRFDISMHNTSRMYKI